MTQVLPPFPILPLDAALETYCDDLQERQAREPGLPLTATEQQVLAWSNFEAACECAGLAGWVASGGYLSPLADLTALLVRCQHTPDPALNRQAYGLYTSLLSAAASPHPLPENEAAAFNGRLQGFWPRMARWMCTELTREQYVREALGSPDPVSAYCELTAVLDTQPHSAAAQELAAWTRLRDQLSHGDLRGWLGAGDGRQGPVHDALGRLRSTEQHASARALGWELVHASRALDRHHEDSWTPEAWARTTRRCQDLSARLDAALHTYYTALLRVTGAGES